MSTFDDFAIGQITKAHDELSALQSRLDAVEARELALIKELSDAATANAAMQLVLRHGTYKEALDAAEKERDEARAIAMGNDELAGKLRDELNESVRVYELTVNCLRERFGLRCMSIQAAGWAADAHDALRTENAELKQRCAKLEGAAQGVCGYLIPVFNNTAVAFESPLPIENLRALEAALAPDSGADCGTKEEV